MTTFKEQRSTDMAVFYNNTEFADPAVYTPGSGAVVDPCPVFVDHDVLIQADGYDMNVPTLGTTVTARVADVGTINRGDTYTLETGLVYTVQRIDRYSEDGLEVTAVVK